MQFLSSKQKPRITWFLLPAAASLSAAASLLFGFLYFTLYWPFRGKFNAEDRYFDETELVVHDAQTGLLVVPMFAFLVLTILFATIWWVNRKPAPGSAADDN